MAKEILFYTGIYSDTAQEFIEKVKSIDDSEDLIIRLNSPGGSVFAGWGMIAAMTERKGKTILKVEGAAASMGFMMALFADEVEALDVTSFMVHRADMWVSDEDDEKLLDSVNAQLRAKIEKKFDAAKFKKVTGVSIEDIFEAEKRRDVWISAKEAKKLGLVNKINRIEPKDMKAYAEKLIAFSGIEEGSQGSELEPQGSGSVEGNAKPNKPNINPKNSDKKMDLNKLKAEHPDVYAEVFKAGVAAEKDRVKAFLAFSKIDAEASIKAINEGTEMTPAFMAEMAVKAASPKAIEEAKEDSTEEIEAAKKAEQDKKTKEQEELEAAEKVVMATAGVTIKEEVK